MMRKSPRGLPNGYPRPSWNKRSVPVREATSRDMGRRANLQKSDGGRVPHGFAYANYALGIGVCVVIGVRQLRRRIWPPSRQGRGRPNPTQFRLYERTYPPEGGERLARLVRSYSNKIIYNFIREK